MSGLISNIISHAMHQVTGQVTAHGPSADAYSPWAKGSLSKGPWPQPMGDGPGAIFQGGHKPIRSSVNHATSQSCHDFLVGFSQVMSNHLTRPRFVAAGKDQVSHFTHIPPICYLPVFRASYQSGQLRQLDLEKNRRFCFVLFARAANTTSCSQRFNTFR